MCYNIPQTYHHSTHYSIPLYKHDSLSRVGGGARVTGLEQRGTDSASSVNLTNYYDVSYDELFYCWMVYCIHQCGMYVECFIMFDLCQMQCVVALSKLCLMDV